MIKKFKKWFYRYRDLKLELKELKYGQSLKNNELIQELTYLRGEVKSVRRTFNLAADIAYQPKYNRSWAVIAINGKQPTVKFIDLDRKYGAEIEEIIRRFEKVDKVVDSPFGRGGDFYVDHF